MNISGKRILITGGARRIGAEITRLLAQSGAEMIIHCNNSTAEAQNLAESLPGAPQIVQMRFAGDPEIGAKKLLQQCGRVDVLVNNASAYRNASDEELWAVNFLWPEKIMAYFAIDCQKRNGIIINMLDAMTLEGNMHSEYEKSKYALAQKTLEYALKFAPEIRVNGVAPGPSIPPDDLAHLKMRKTLPLIPLHKAVAPADIACAVKFLIENDSATGSIIPIDGGMRLTKCV